MTNKLVVWTISGVMFFMTSCDCVVSHQGYVLDSKTEKPIADATITFDKREFQTDSSGYFNIDYITGFCPDWYFQVEKEDYKTQKITIDLDDDEIVYRIQSDSDDSYYHEKNSLNFKIKNDTIYFYLTDTGVH